MLIRSALHAFCDYILTSFFSFKTVISKSYLDVFPASIVTAVPVILAESSEQR